MDKVEHAVTHIVGILNHKMLIMHFGKPLN